MAGEGPAATERVLAAFHAQIKSGVFSIKDYTLILSNERIIVARLTADMIATAAKAAAAEAKREGKGFFGQAVASLSSGTGVTKKYYTMEPQAILAEHAESFFIPNSDVVSITYKRGRTYYDKDDQAQQQDDQLIIASVGRSYRLSLPQSSTPTAELLSTLAALFGVKVRKG